MVGRESNFQLLCYNNQMPSFQQQQKIHKTHKETRKTGHSQRKKLN